MRRLLWLAFVTAALVTLPYAGAVTLRAQQASPDSDGDSVPDAQDCAPADATLSSPHMYYWDSDGDQAGDLNNPVLLCSLTPFPGTSPWGGDENITDIRVAGRITAKGARHIGIDMLDAPESRAWRPDRGRELGADTLTLVVPWNAIETTPGTFNGALAGVLPIIDAVASSEGYRLNLTVSVITRSSLMLPADLEAALASGTLRFGDAQFSDRFSRVLDFVHTSLSHATLASLQVGDEFDQYVLHHQDAQFWAGFAQFVGGVRLYARSLWGADLPVAATASYAGLLDATVAPLVNGVIAAGDVVSVTYVPHNADFTVSDPINVPLDIQRLIAAYYPKKLFFQSVGYPSSPRVLSSTTKQSQFMRAFFYTWDSYPDFIPFVSFRRLNDLAPAAASAAGAGDANAAAFYGSLGLRTWNDDGTQKSAYYTLRTLTMMRGWWEVRPTTHRSFLLGMVPAPYDQVPGGPQIPAVLDNLMGEIGRQADLVTYYFDLGVPWVEAYADTFHSTEPPYSADVKSWWAGYRDRQPPGIKVAVAVNPLGIPRSRVAPYWGVGEGFYHDATFNLVGTGVVQDYQNRLLPPPWNSYDLDSPQVEQAFLNYCRRVIDYFHPTYLITGVEVNLAFQENPAFYAKYVELQRYVYTQLKADPRYAQVQIVVSLIAESFVTDELGLSLYHGPENTGLDVRNLDALDALLPYTDVVGLSVYPIKSRLLAYEIPGGFFENLFDKLRAHTSKPFAITETGYPAESFEVNGQPFHTDASKQALFLRFLASEVEKHGGVEFVSQYIIRDATAYMDKLRARAQETPPFMSPALVEFFKYFEFTGFYDSSGHPRPAAQIWNDLFKAPLDNPDRITPSLTLASPDAALTATFSADPSGHLQYALARGGHVLMDGSPIGVAVDEVDLGGGVTNLVASSTVEVNEHYATRGIHATATNHYRETTITVRRAGHGDLSYAIDVRLFDDAFAWRYVIPGDGARTISGESTGWRLPAGSTMWHQVSTGNYESELRRATIGTFGDRVGGPFTVELPDDRGLITVTEARLRDYTGMTFHADLGSTLVRAEFLDDVSWQVQGGTATPWRVTIAVDTLDALVNSDAVSNLSDPPDPALFPAGPKTAWIQPGRAVWSWWTDFYSGFSLETQRQYVDYATRLRADFVLVDAWWELGFAGGGLDQFQRLAELTAYGRSGPRDVGIWVWKSWYELVDPTVRQAFFRSVRDAGAVGVKVDNVVGDDSDSMASVRLYEAILRDAAAVHLMVNFHGSSRPTGLSRTYPNEITREAIAGLELNSLAWDRGLFIGPQHNAALPFVRMVAGPGDYTPVTFDARKLGKTTFTHQLALAGVMTSPLLHYADNPELLLAQRAVQDILRTLPTEWDETVVLPASRIGELAMMARRHGARWYVFAINGDGDHARDVNSLPLAFLGAGRYNAVLVSDATKTSFARQQRSGVVASDTIDVHLLAGGGFVAVFEPAADPGHVVPQGISSIAPSSTGAGWVAAYTILRDNADIVAHAFDAGVPWPEAMGSADSATYPVALRAEWDALRSADAAVLGARPRLISISPIDASTWNGLAPYWSATGRAPLPAPWNAYAFDRPEVRTAFLNYAIAAVEFFHPAYLAIAVDANALLARAPQQWTPFKALIASVHDALKLRYPSLTVFVSVGYEDLLRLYPEAKSFALAVRDSYPRALELEVIDLLRHSDLIGISTWPCRVESSRYIGADGTLDRDYFDQAFAMAMELGKPVAVEQSGCASADVAIGNGGTWSGSERLQQEIVNRLLHDAHVGQVAFVVNTIGQDHGPAYGDDPVHLERGFSGLIRADGTPKPALDTWTSYRGASSSLTMTAIAPGGAADVSPAPASGPTFNGMRAAIGRLLTGEAVNAATLALSATSETPPTPELFVRSQQVASLLPDFQAPPGSDPTAPWQFGDPYAAAARVSLARRALLLPYLEPLFRDAAVRRTSPVLTLASQFSDAAAAEAYAPEFTIGPDLLVAPIVVEGATSRVLYLPSGSGWTDWHTGQTYGGGQAIAVQADLDRIPMFVRQVAAP